jgi:hypothetical protein
LHDGTAVAIVFALFCVLVAVSVYLHPTVTQFVLASAFFAFAFIWVGVQNFGGDLAGGATDPNSGLLVLLFITTYWPLTATRSGSDAVNRDLVAAPARREA